jgi:hypothetical protein
LASAERNVPGPTSATEQLDEQALEHRLRARF